MSPRAVRSVAYSGFSSTSSLRSGYWYLPFSLRGALTTSHSIRDVEVEPLEVVNSMLASSSPVCSISIIARREALYIFGGPSSDSRPP